MTLSAYGSRAAQTLHWLHQGGALAAGSNDLDLAVSGGIDRRYSLAEKVALASAFSDLFEFEMIDLADMAEVDPFVAANIVRGERLYSSDRIYADELDLYVLRHAGDLTPYERERLAHIESAIMTGADNGSERVTRRPVLDRLGRVEQSLAEIRNLPLDSLESSQSDSRNVRTAESCLRRSLEALLDVGRHLIAKLVATGVAEYNGVGRSLSEHGVFDTETADLLVKLAGYRNRMVHFYHEVTASELFGICANELRDLERIRAAYVQWMRQHADLVDDDL